MWESGEKKERMGSHARLSSQAPGAVLSKPTGGLVMSKLSFYL
jgi:hypothetical protein